MKKQPWWLAELRAMRACKDGLKSIEMHADFGAALSRAPLPHLLWFLSQLGLCAGWYPSQGADTDDTYEMRLQTWAVHWRHRLEDLFRRRRQLRLLKLQVKKLKARR